MTSEVAAAVLLTAVTHACSSRRLSASRTFSLKAATVGFAAIDCEARGGDGGFQLAVE